MEETRRNAKPNEDGGVLMSMIGAREAAERMKRMKLKKERTIFGKELLRLEKAISRTY